MTKSAWRQMMAHLLRMTVCLGMLCAALALSGCETMQAYAGEDLPADQVALIKSGFHFGEQVELLSVDAKELGSNENKAEVLPGSHTMTARLRVPHGSDVTYYSSRMTLTLGAEAGHTYELFGQASGGGWFKAPTRFTIWIQDKDSETVMARAND